MKFGPVSTDDCVGGILAHSIALGSKRLRKGRPLTEKDAQNLKAAGIEEVTVAVLEDGDIGEDSAADRIAKALLGGTDGLSQSAPFTGRVNLYADRPGLIELKSDAVLRINRIDPAITLATLPNLSRVSSRSMAATIKIITYAVSKQLVAAAEEAAKGALRLRKVMLDDAGLILTETPGQKPSLAEKGKQAVRKRLGSMGIRLVETLVVKHETQAVRNALSECRGSILLLFTGSATSDSNDVGPAGLRLAGGTLRRFGMPVDPGNLLFHGTLGLRPVVGLPGCARSPALNGADWVLERLVCGIEISDEDFAAMGVGGLLKEIPVRPHPRVAAASSARPAVAVLALLFDADGDASTLAANALESDAESVNVVASDAVLANSDLPSRSNIVAIPSVDDFSRYAVGFRLGLEAVENGTDAVLVIRNDSPPDAESLNRLIAAFSPADGREICYVSENSLRRGGPVLFGRRFFEPLSALQDERSMERLAADQREFAFEIE